MGLDAESRKAPKYIPANPPEKEKRDKRGAEHPGATRTTEKQGLEKTPKQTVNGKGFIHLKLEVRSGVER